jgi:hypothetical protein
VAGGPAQHAGRLMGWAEGHWAGTEEKFFLKQNWIFLIYQGFGNFHKEI